MTIDNISCDTTKKRQRETREVMDHHHHKYVNYFILLCEISTHKMHSCKYNKELISLSIKACKERKSQNIVNNLKCEKLGLAIDKMHSV